MKTKLLIISLLGFIFVLVDFSIQVISSVGLSTHILGADYDSFLLGGRLLAQGHRDASSLYNLDLQKQTQQVMLTGSGVSFPHGLLPFLNPPFVALLLLPFGLMPDDISFILWDVVQFAILLVSLWLLGPLLPGKSRYLLWLGALAFLPVYQNLLEGQLSAILLLGITLLWRGMRMGAEVWGGAMLGLCLFKPQLLPLFIVYLLYKRTWRAIGGFVAGGIAIYVLSAAISGLAWPAPYINALLDSGNIGYGYEPSTMYNLIGLLDRLQLNYWLLIIATTFVVVGFLLYGWWHSDHHTKAISSRNQEDDLDMGVGTLELQLAVTTVAAALVSPHLYPHDLTILLFSGAVLLGWASDYGWHGWLFGLFLFNLLIPPLTFYTGPISGVFVLLMLLTFVAIISLLIGSAPKEVTSLSALAHMALASLVYTPSTQLAVTGALLLYLHL